MVTPNLSSVTWTLFWESENGSRDSFSGFSRLMNTMVAIPRHYHKVGQDFGAHGT